MQWMPSQNAMVDRRVVGVADLPVRDGRRLRVTDTELTCSATSQSKKP